MKEKFISRVGRRKFIRAAAVAGTMAAMPWGWRSSPQLFGQTASPGPADWPGFGYDLHNTRFNAAERTLGRDNVGNLQLKWNKMVEAPIQTVPTVVGDTLFFGTMAGYQYALDARTGREKWKFFVGYDHSYGGNPGIRSSCRYDNGRIYFGTGMAKVHCLEADSGKEVWQTQVDDDPARNNTQIFCSTAVSNGKVYVGTSSTQAQAVCLDANTGAVRWRFYVVPDRSRDGGGSIWTAPAVDEETNTVYFVTGSVKSFMPPDPMLFTESIIAFDADTGEMLWYDQLRRADPFDLDFGCHPIVFDAVHPSQPSEVRRCVGAGNKAGFYCFNRTTGQRYWKNQLTPAGGGSGLRLNNTAVAYNRVFVVSAAGGVPGRPASSVAAALHAYTGDILWWVANPATSLGPVAVANEVFYQGLENGTLEAIDTANGRQLWTYQLPRMIRGGVSIANGWLYTATGRSQSWRLDDTSSAETFGIYAFQPSSS